MPHGGQFKLGVARDDTRPAERVEVAAHEFGDADQIGTSRKRVEETQF